MSQPPSDSDPGWGDPAPPAAWASPSGGADAPADAPGVVPPSAVPPAPGPAYGPGPGYGPPGYGPGPGYGPPGYGPGPGYGPPGYAPGPGYGPAPGAWRPPALQPGIIPLRPLGLGEILDGTMKAVRFNPKVTFGLTAVVVTVCVTLATLLTTYVSGFFMAELRDALEIEDDSVVLMTLSQYGTAPFLYVATPLLNGLLIVAVSKAVLGRKVGVGEVVRSRRIWAVLGFSVLVFVGTLVVSGLFVGLVVALASIGGTGGAAAAVVVGVLGGLALVAGSLWLMVRTLLVPPALMLEGERFWPTVVRAWRLTRGSFWRLLGLYLLVGLMLGVLTSVVSVPLAVVSSIFAIAGNTWATLLVSALTLVLTYTVTIAFEAVVVALLYIDVRMRREGLDLELARSAAEAPT